MDEANRNEHHWDYYGMDRTELGIIEPDEDDTILAVDNWEDIMVEVVLDSGSCRSRFECQPARTWLHRR